MKRPPKDEIAKQLATAQLSLVEKALVEFIEARLGRVPSEDEILKSSFHLTFAPTPLSTYEHEGKTFCQYWVWDGIEVVALGFLDTNDLLTLYTARVPQHNWPWAVRAAIEQWKEKKA